MSEPQPIETAPKDGRTVLIYPCKGGKGHFGWVTAYWHQPGNPTAKGFWMGNQATNNPQFWMPLPQEPSHDLPLSHA